jgi:PII-like signaling protein
VLAPGPAKKITIHINEDTGSRTDFLSREVLALLLDRGVAGATMDRPEAGFGSHHRLHSTIGDREHLPMRIEFIETKEAVEALLPALCELVTDGLIEAQDITILKAAAGEEPS